MKRFTIPSLSIVLASALLAFAQQGPPQTGKSTVQSPDAGLPLNFQRHTGDLNAMVKAQNIRALVLYSRSSFFYVDGRPQGIFYEALQDFEQFVNRKLPAGQRTTGRVLGPKLTSNRFWLRVRTSVRFRRCRIWVG